MQYEHKHISARLEFEALTSQLRTLNRLSHKGYIANEQIKARQERFKAFNEKEKKRLEQIKSNMHIRELKQEQAKAKQELNKSTVKTKVNRQRIKRTNADDAFSLCVRLRANCTCERCGETFPMNAMKHLHCSHNYSREYKQVRFHPDNAFALCKDCHWWFAKNKVEATAWKNEKLGEQRLKTTFQALQSDHLKEISKTTELQIAAYYNLTAYYLKQAREQGNSDYLTFDMFHELQ